MVPMPSLVHCHVYMGTYCICITFTKLEHSIVILILIYIYILFDVIFQIILIIIFWTDLISFIISY